MLYDVVSEMSLNLQSATFVKIKYFKNIHNLKFYISKSLYRKITQVFIAVILSKKHFFEPNTFVYMFNVSIL